MSCKPCESRQTIADSIKNSKYRIELFANSNEDANLIVHSIGEDFLELEKVLGKFIDKIQEQIDNKQKCPFFKSNE